MTDEENTRWQDRARARFHNPPTRDEQRDYFGRRVFEVNRKVFEGHMWYTPLLDRMAYYVIQGQLPNIRTRNFRIGRRLYDNRVHGVAFVPSGSGKAGLTQYAGLLTSGVGLDFYVMGQATDTALVGRRYQDQEYNRETQRMETVIKEERGCLNPAENHHLIHYNEADILFDSKKTEWAKDIMTIFQKAMNTYNTYDNLQCKNTSMGRIEFYTSVSFLIVSKLPESFYRTITSTGFLQRTLLAYIEQDWERKKLADKKTLELFCDDTSEIESDVKEEDVCAVLRAVNRFYKDVGKIKIEEDTKKILTDEIFSALHEPLESMTPYAQTTLAEFVSRWQEQIINFSYHNCFARLGKSITVQDVADAKNIVYPLWKNVIYAIEDGLQQPKDEKWRWNRQLSQMIKMVELLAEKFDSEWVPRNTLVKAMASKNLGWGVNQETARLRIARAEKEGYLERKSSHGSSVVRVTAKPKDN